MKVEALLMSEAKIGIKEKHLKRYLKGKNMKMRFTIAYKANWGEQLQVDLTYLARDGY